MPDSDDSLLELAELRESLLKLMQPEVLKELADFLEAVGTDKSMVQRYKWFVENSTDGYDCRYARAAKQIFLEDEASDIAARIRSLYANWAKFMK